MQSPLHTNIVIDYFASSLTADNGDSGVNIPNKVQIYIWEMMRVPAYFWAELEILNKRWQYHIAHLVLRRRDKYLLYSVWCSSRP